MIVIIYYIINAIYNIYYIRNFKQGRSHIDSPDWINNKKATLNLINECCQYVVTVALNCEKIKGYPENKYNWEGINFPSKKDNLKKIEKNN